MNDIRPPRRPTLPAPQPRPQFGAPGGSIAQPPATPEPTVASSNTPPLPAEPPHKKRAWPKRLAIGVVAALVLLGLVLLGVWYWYGQQLRAVQPDSSEQVRVKVEPGTGPAAIAQLLKDQNLIHSTIAFEWYVRLHGVAGSLQTGTYKVARSADVPAIVEQMASGRVDSFTITFIPGHTLQQHRDRLIAAGFSAVEVDNALEKSYDHPLFASKPPEHDLEGYIFGETYQFAADATVEQVLLHTFDIYYQVITEHNLKTKYKAVGLSLFEGITLASIIERESANMGEIPRISQVFHLRLKRGMPLGSDPTYQYIADKTGQPRSPSLDSPYNTRIVKGLPPGPIASPGEEALIAAAKPAEGNFLYFVHGDDGKTYFSHTNQEHEANVRQHCQEKCQIL